MSIRKALLLASMALTAIAFAAPAAAQAEVVLTENEGEVVLEEGDHLTATSTNLVTRTTQGNFTCEKVTLHLEVEENGPEHITATQLGEATTEGCKLDTPIGNFTAEITDGTLGVEEEHTITFNEAGTAETNATFIGHVPALGVSCHFVGSLHIQARESGSDILDVGPSALVATEEESCPVAGGTMEGSFTLETEDGTPVQADF